MSKVLIVACAIFVSLNAYAMNSELSECLVQKSADSAELLADWAMKQYGITSSRESIIAILHELPYEKQLSLLKLTTKKRRRSSTTTTIPTNIGVFLLKSLDKTVAFQEQQSELNREITQRHLQFAKIATIAEIVAGFFIVIASNILNYYLSNGNKA